MSIARTLARWGGMRAARKLSRSMPWIGGLLALGTVAGTIRQKGMARGLLDTALTATPVVGGIKSALEIARGRDLIADRRRA
jgi:hypothetical protein